MSNKPKDESLDDFFDAFFNSLGVSGNNQGQNLPARNHSNDSDFAAITSDDYEAVMVSDADQQKITELETIISSIEKREPDNSAVNINSTYKINYRHELNASQLKAVTTVNGPLLVIAGAGSGKTRIITYRTAFMLESGIAARDILLLTFTRKAAAEMTGRVQELLPDVNSGSIFGGTFHAFSNYILRKHAAMLNLAPNFSIIDTEDSKDTIDLIKTELKLNSKESAFPKKARIQEIISSSRNRNMTIEAVIEADFTGLEEYIDEIKLIAAGYERYKKICNLMDYDDLMDVLRDSLKGNSMFRQKLQHDYKYIMVDEYQDTNVTQREIVYLLADHHKNVMVVGDDAQSIYSFRGANYENILRFPQQYPNCGIVKIEENYRSNQRILDFTNDIIHNARIGYKKKLYSSIKHENMPLVRKFYDQQTEAEYIVTEILNLRERGVELNQVSVLVRAFWHARFIEAELNRRNIPYVAVGGLAFIERRHVKDMISYLRLLQNPYDAVSWHRVLKLIPGVGSVTSRKIVEKINKPGGMEEIVAGNKKHADDLASLFGALRSANRSNISVAAKVEIMRDYYSPVLKALESDYQIRLLDIAALIELAGRYNAIDKFLSDFALDPPSKRFANKNTPLIDEGEDKPMTISTIHSAKGLEWYAVFVPHVLDGLIPSSKAMSNLEELEEERRLFYVACSRAKEQLILTMPSFVTTYNGFLSYPSRFLIEIDKSKFRFEV